MLHLSHRSAAPRGGNQEKYELLIHENKLLFTADLVKEMLEQAYKETSEVLMAQDITEIINICNATENPYFRNQLLTDKNNSWGSKEPIIDSKRLPEREPLCFTKRSRRTVPWLHERRKTRKDIAESP